MSISMLPSRLISWLAGNRLARRLADVGMGRYARQRLAELDAIDPARVQEHTLQRLLRRAQHTRFGRDHDFARIRSVEDYQRLVPLRDYEAFWDEYWRRAFPRLTDATWPGTVPYLALSSGTTSGTTKYIPVSRAMIDSNSKAALTALTATLTVEPDARLFQGKMFFLGGSTDLTDLDGVLSGDLSGIAAREIPVALRPYSFPPLDLALVSDWEQKVDLLARASAALPITVVSGVPSWILVLFDRLKQVTGKSRITEVWPALRLIIHGGTKFDAYRGLFEREVAGSPVRFLETYPCSEGFVAFEDPRHERLRLIPDIDIFFEFVPVEDLERDRPARHTVATIEPGVQYAVVLTTCAGLWSYIVGDTIVFESRRPPLLRFTGRTKYFLSAFGEHLISEEVERAMAAAASATGSAVTDFHVGPLFPARPGEIGRHLYLAEFVQAPPALSRFAQELDEELCRLNDDYRTHRASGIGMEAPEVRVVARGGFSAWMRSQGKLGGQHKVPRMDNSGTVTRHISRWMTAEGFLAPSRLAEPEALAKFPR